MKVLIPLMLCFLILNCGDADDVDELEIIDQTLQGTINGEDWTLVHGIARMDEKDGTVSITMIPVTASKTSQCSVPSTTKVRVFS